ncbi:transcription factor BHLH148-like [Musa acuminata AAA Group]|uniref:transcription factor BHLH148-like n=1 Tax=Musa acuminata AAA Group TaxID=214697 RepID=UPI0031DD2E82
MEGDLLGAFFPELPLDYSSAAFLLSGLVPEFDAPRTAFVSYLRQDGPRTMVERSGSGRNIHRSLIEMLRSIPRAEERRTAAASRGFRHMMRERKRREKLSQSYSDLCSMLASGSKCDKNSIVKSATKHVQELKGVKEALQQRYEELKAKVLGSDPTEGEKSMDATAKAIRAHLSSSELSAVMSIDTKMAAADVERAIEGAAMEAEKRLRC